MKIRPKYLQALTKAASYLKRHYSRLNFLGKRKVDEGGHHYGKPVRSDEVRSVSPELQDIAPDANLHISPENPEQRYIATNARAPPIEQIIQEGIRDDEHIDNVVFEILKLHGVDKDYLQNKAEESGYETEQRICRRAAQVWERRARLENFLANYREELEPDLYLAGDSLGEIFGQEMLEDGYESGPFSDPAFYALSYLQIDKYRNKAKGGKVLDIGTSDGTFLHLLRSHGYGGIGLEINDYVASKGKQKGLNIISGNIFYLPEELQGQKFPITVSIMILDVLNLSREYKGIFNLHSDSCYFDRKGVFFQRMAELTEIGGISVNLYGGQEIDNHILQAEGRFEIIEQQSEIGCSFVLRRT